ncbi:hypothetical protein JHK87_004507 [Glycine soja]|nr:hypothetical protein JHK87_004507 [Glycine soja]
MVSNGEVGSQFSQFSTQIGLEEIIIEEIGGSSTKRKSRVVFAIEEDTHLIRKEAFWLRVKENHNKFRGVQKFKGHYKQAVSLKKSGCMDNDIMLNPYVIWKEDEGSDFGLEHAWRLLKDQLKWLGQFTKNCSERTKNFAFGAYSLSSNPGTSVEDAKADTPSPIVRPIMWKRVGTSTNHVNLIGVEEATREINVLDTKLAALRKNELENEYYDILMKDTSTMSKTQLEDHQAFCKIIRRKLGI